MHYKELTSLHHTTVTGVINLPQPRSFNSLILEFKNFIYGKCRSEKKIWFMICCLNCSKWSNSPKNFFSLRGGIYKLSFLQDSIHLRHLYHKYTRKTPMLPILIFLHRYLNWKKNNLIDFQLGWEYLKHRFISFFYFLNIKENRSAFRVDFLIKI